MKSSTQKTNLHARNKHRNGYDFKALCETYPQLSAFVQQNKYGNDSIDFFNAAAVKALNKALLLHFYNLSYWDIPENYLCPPIPSRADYLHYVADLLSKSNDDKIPSGKKIKCLDIGVGANCVYPIIGVAEYGWSFIASDIDTVALDSAKKISDANENLKNKVEFRLQKNSSQFFADILQKGEQITLTICNPPFHSSQEEANKGTLRKLSNLKKKTVTSPQQNFGGQNTELWTEGGEKQFILNMIQESKTFAKSCMWFTTLVSKESNLDSIYNALDAIGAYQYKTIPMSQGNKISRILAWTFLTEKQRRTFLSAQFFFKV